MMKKQLLRARLFFVVDLSVEYKYKSSVTMSAYVLHVLL